jgi:hypothetical protein
MLIAAREKREIRGLDLQVARFARAVLVSPRLLLGGQEEKCDSQHQIDPN